ncbi:RNA polymerase sigma-70 factor [Dyadobacter psychrotolerans]|uniref:RNA polymerase sigma-70 factor n=1 Tax=Dyadobacter psychrotolerans TaxID=2541721 RepID=A0A4R5E2F2_9BACT|nr:RNA polymerase sigma-70 factor [Dyadobacter psychrotolerans]TDE18273.1 RNA polymerase sigma-70 factor [Dyadobacter psychrotolerans]
MQKLLSFEDSKTSLNNEQQTVFRNEEDAVQEEKTDTELFIRLAFKENAKKGCELLFRRYHKALCSHAVRFVYSREIAEDLVSDVFCKFWKTRSFESVTTSFRYYLFRSVRNEAYNYLRLEFKKMENIEAAELQESSRSQQPDNIAQYEDMLKMVEVIVETLPTQCRKIFLMNRFEGKKYQEIADELGISIKTVEVHIGKALGTMRNGLREHWIS